jgi:tRNA A-37 threonylcarbamoyl transferase component Bud32/tetratricopeptide (TPR) repeat protein
MMTGADHNMVRTRRAVATDETNPSLHDDTVSDTLTTLSTQAGESAIRDGSSVSMPAQLGDFVVERGLGAGAMGEVFAARHVVTGERVALKRLARASATSLYRFKREFRALADVVHPNLVRLGELVIVPGGTAFFTMELVAGEPFDKYVRRSTPVGEAPNLVRLARAFRQLIGGVQRMHAARFVHRDLKPSNVLVTQEGRVVILDFGLIVESADPDAAITTIGQVLGTPAYMAPEQVGGGDPGPAVDLYAIGVMLFECLTGRLPFRGSALNVMLDKQSGEVPDPRAVVPSVPPELAACCMRLLDVDPEQRPDCEALLEQFRGAAGSGAKWTRDDAEIFVGRARELAILESSLATMQAEGRAVTVFVRGASGLGKTTLVARFFARASEQTGALVLRGRCFERESVPFKGVDAVVDALSAHLRRLPKDEAAELAPRRVEPLVKIFPVLDGIWPTSMREGVSDDPQRLWQLGVSSLREVLSRCAGARPLIVHIEDFQWADVDGAKLLTELMRPSESLVVLLVVTFRNEIAQREVLRDLTSPTALRDREVRDIELLPLSEAETASLASALIGAGEDIASNAIAQAKGSPFFLRQLLAARDVSSSAIGESEGSLDRIVVHRIAQLSPGVRRMLAVIAVAGRPIARTTVLGIHDQPPAIAELDGMGLIVIDERRVDAQVEAAHDRIREVMVAELDTTELRELHLALARALAERGAAPELLAEHFERGGDRELALEYVEQAAAQAAGALGFARAAELYQRALALLPEDAKPERRDALRAALAEQVGNVGRCGEAAAMFLQLVEQSSDAAQIVAYRHQAITQLIASGQIEPALDVLEAALASFGEKLPRRKWPVIFAVIVGRLRLAWRGSSVELRSEAELDPRTQQYLATLLAGTGGLMSQEALLTTMLQGRLLYAALDAGESFYLALALMWEMILSYNAGFPVRARAIVDRVHAMAVASKDPIVEGIDVVNDSTFDYMSRQWLDADRKWDQLLANFEDLPRMGRICRRLRGFRSQTKIILGSFAALGERLPEWSADAIRAGRRQETVEMLAFSALVEVFDGELERAGQLIDEGRSSWNARRYTVTEFFLDYAEVPLRIARSEWQQATVQIERSLENARRWQFLRVISIREEMFDLHARSFAALAVHANDRRAARKARAGARLLRRSKHPMSKARAEVIEAALHTMSGELDRAGACWRAALPLFEACGMRAHQAAMWLRLAELAPADEAVTLRANAAAYCAGEGVAEPQRLLRVLAPARA